MVGLYFGLNNHNTIMRTRQSVLSFLLVTVFLSNCTKNSNEPPVAACQPPTTLVAQAPCESGYPGTLLIASDYKGGSTIQFDYDIFVQKDTLASDLTTSSYRNASNERILIADAVLKDAPKFVVKVSTNCGGGQNDPYRYFAFVKRPSANSSCYTWAQQKQ